MKAILRTMAAAYAVVLMLGLSLGGCATFGALVGDSASDKIKTGAEYSLTVIKTAWIPALRTYAALSACPAAAPLCRDKALYAKLYSVTDAVTLCMQAATREELTLTGYQACEVKFNEARAEFSRARLTKEVVQ